jgi:hypothetical protein
VCGCSEDPSDSNKTTRVLTLILPGDAPSGAFLFERPLRWATWGGSPSDWRCVSRALAPQNEDLLFPQCGLAYKGRRMRAKGITF